MDDAIRAALVQELHAKDVRLEVLALGYDDADPQQASGGWLLCLCCAGGAWLPCLCCVLMGPITPAAWPASQAGGGGGVTAMARCLAVARSGTPAGDTHP